MNILFSPVGNTDPIANDMDGAMLHICRHYPIDHVVMYMSKEILAHHRADNRYADSLERLAKHLGRKITHEVVERPELENVQVFDGFIADFGALLSGIHERYPDAAVCLNVSSGTPAMKSALQVLAAYREFDYKPIQVAGSGYRENRKPFDIKKAFDDDFDNLPESQNRCSVSTNLDLLAETKKKMMTALIDKYDYAGALLLAKDMSGLSEGFLALLKGADLRYKFELEAAREKFASAGCEDMLYDSVPEYLLILCVKNKRDELADFLRAITPLILVLNKSALKTLCGLDIDLYTENTQEGDVWSYKKIKAANDSAANKAMNYFDDQKTVYSSMLNKLIGKLSTDTSVIRLFNDLRIIEKERNQVAHNLKSISRKELHAMNIGSVDEILRKLYAAAVMTGLLPENKEPNEKKARDKFFSAYDLMNQKLKELL